MALNFGNISHAGALLSRVISAAPVGLAFADLQLHYVMANDAFAPFGGAPLNHLIGRTVQENAPLLWPQIQPLVRRAIDLGEATYDFDVILDGAVSRKWRASFFPVQLDGRLAGVGISVADLQGAGDKPDGVGGQSEQVEEIQYSLDIDRRNPASPDRVLDLLGIHRAEFAADDDTFLNAIFPDDGPAMNAELSDGDGDNAVAIEHRLVSADGAVRWIHERAEFLVGESGRQTLIGTVQHITERNETETRLHQMQSELLHVSRLSAMGQVSSTLAHEVNQPLTAVGNYIRAGLLMLDSGDQYSRMKIRGVFEKAAQQAARASDIVRNLRAFVRKGDTASQPENLTIVVQEAMALARLGIKDRGLKVRLRLDGNSSWASVNRIQIQQVLVNLIRNAIEAMSESPRREVLVSTASAGRDFIEVSVADSGPGLTEPVAQGLFKPFVTTKRDGMGVGLAICHSIIEAHGGKIWAEPNHAGGTIFRFTVPRSDSESISQGSTGQ
ncbi:MAG: fixL [Rhodospirillales bacterium]|nr:fixL [Rhodospirillales bacterium]